MPSFSAQLLGQNKSVKKVKPVLFAGFLSVMPELNGRYAFLID
ncbi:hypothetical protein QFZ72_001200 [Bacillus sp. V2I10]|nr:hypothetical protein [Bacillus sp. V2I10]